MPDESPPAAPTAPNATSPSASPAAPQSAPAPADAPPQNVTAASAQEVPGELPGHAEIDELLKQASFEDPSTEPATAAPPLPDVNSFDLPNFQQVMQDAQVSSIDLLRDVDLNVKIELG